MHALIDSTGAIVRRQEFEGEAPALATAKGLRWVPDEPPPHNAETHYAPQPVLPVTGDQVTYLDPAPIPIDAEANARAARIRAAQEKLASSDLAERFDALLDLLALMPGWPPQP